MTSAVGGSPLPESLSGTCRRLRYHEHNTHKVTRDAYRQMLAGRAGGPHQGFPCSLLPGFLTHQHTHQHTHTRRHTHNPHTRVRRSRTSHIQCRLQNLWLSCTSQRGKQCTRHQLPCIQAHTDTLWLQDLKSSAGRMGCTPASLFGQHSCQRRSWRMWSL